MASTAQRSSIVLPVLLAVIGVASLATSVMLVPVIIRTSMSQVQTTMPAPPPTPAPEPTAPTPATRPAPPAQPPAPEPASEQAEPPAPEPTGSWVLVLDPKSYALDDASSAMLDQIVSYMATHPKTRLALTGVNNPMRSSKRAKQAARRVKETLIESGVERYRVSMAGKQEEGARGLIVRAETAEDAP